MCFASFGSPTGKLIVLDLACIRQARCILIRKAFENGARAIAQVHHPAVFNLAQVLLPLGKHRRGAAINAIGEPAFFTDILHQSGLKIAAPDDFIGNGKVGLMLQA